MLSTSILSTAHFHDQSFFRHLTLTTTLYGSEPRSVLVGTYTPLPFLKGHFQHGGHCVFGGVDTILYYMYKFRLIVTE